MSELRERIIAALAKPLKPDDQGFGAINEFDPWGDLIDGIFGSYASESDRLMIGAMEAVRDKTTLDFIRREGFAGEFMLYVLSGHGMLDYGTSPRGGWPDPEIADLWDALIAKWRAYADTCWGKGWDDAA